MEAVIAVAELSDRFSLMGASIVPQDDHLSSQVTQEVEQEVTGLRLLDILRVALKVEAQVMTLGTDGYPRDDGDLVAAVMMALDRGLATWRPSLAHWWDQEKSGLVDEDEVGSQPGGVFLSEAIPPVSTVRSPPRCAPQPDVRASGGSIASVPANAQHGHDGIVSRSSSR